MTTDEIKLIIFRELKKIAPDTEPEQLNPDEKFRDALDIDSFDALRFIVALNEKIGINIPEVDYGKTTSLNKLVEYILTKKNN